MSDSLNYQCQNCSYISVQWLGKCPKCHEWNSLQKPEDKSKINQKRNQLRPMNIAEIKSSEYSKISTGIEEFDVVLDGGITRGSVVLIGGGPGVGKSTLMMTVFNSLAKKLPSESFLYVSGEESQEQVASRAKRLGIASENILIYHQTQWPQIQKEIEKANVKFLILDSIQTTQSTDLATQMGSVNSIKEVCGLLIDYCKLNGLTAFVIGHVTKEGPIAGPKLLEHMVDTVIYFEGEECNQYRILRSVKNRFGSVNEIGLFEMSKNGLINTNRPVSFFLENNKNWCSGRCITGLIEGSRFLLTEIQALVIDNKFGNPKRVANGIDSNQFALLVAVIEKYLHIPISQSDIFINIVGGYKSKSRDLDLAIVAALLSSYKSKVINQKKIFMGEVGLGGEIRSIKNFSKRIAELDKIDNLKIITSKQINNYNSPFCNKKIDIIGLDSVSNIMDLLEA